MARPILQITLTEAERAELQRRVASTRTSKRDSGRAEIILLRADGVKQEEVAKRLGTSEVRVSKWTSRFMKTRLTGLVDKPGRGRKARISPRKIESVITKSLQTPPAGRTRWSVRTMAESVGVSRHTVHRIWRHNDIRPHLARTFKISTDPEFERKFWDVIGLYLNPPDKALVLCCDEKSQCQALERTQPGLPLGLGHIRTRTHDYTRHGTITLFAALNYLDGHIISRPEESHSHVEWLRFLKQIDRETPKPLAVHLIVDNYATHKHAAIKTWLEKHLRFHMHFTPTGSSWMNLVERFFAELTADVVRDGSFQSVRELVHAIESYLATRNLHPKPYRWRAKGEEILRKIEKARAALGEAVK
jgi:transposase